MNFSQALGPNHQCQKVAQQCCIEIKIDFVTTSGFNRGSFPYKLPDFGKSFNLHEPRFFWPEILMLSSWKHGQDETKQHTEEIGEVGTITGSSATVVKERHCPHPYGFYSPVRRQSP